MKAAEATVEVHRFAAVIDLRPRIAMRVVAEDHATAAGELEPAVEAEGLCGEDVLAAEQVPEFGLATAEQVSPERKLSTSAARPWPREHRRRDLA